MNFLKPKGVIQESAYKKTEFLEMAFQSLLKNKIENFENLENKDKKFILDIFENGFEIYQRNPFFEIKSQSDQIQDIKEKLPVKFLRIGQYYFFLSILAVSGSFFSFLI